jgi:hypothetical protein
VPTAQFPNLTVLASHFADVDPDKRFELLLDIFVGAWPSTRPLADRRPALAPP